LREAVLDASVVLKWFREAGEHNVEAARGLRAEFEAGRLIALAPPLLFLEILNIAGRRWRLPGPAVEQLASALPKLGLQLVEPDLTSVAHWIIGGLTAYDAAYVAVAEQTGAPLITDDAEIARVAPKISISLTGYSPST
jgi:predicted nucleic acid-binding protein